MSRRKLITLIAIAVILVSVSAKKLIRSDSVPKLGVIEGDIQKVELDRDGITLSLEKSGETWLIGDKKYPASNALVRKIISAVTDMKLYEKVSSKKNYGKYDLDEKGIKVKAYAGGKVVREMTIGKQATSSSQAYVLVKNDPDVYLAGTFSVNDLRKPADDLREKQILKLSPDSVTKIGVEYEGKSYVLIKEETAGSEDPQENVSEWKIENDPVPCVQDKVKAILAKLDPLLADSFIERYEEPEKPLAVITITAYEKAIIVTIFEKSDSGYIAKCSESPYYFRIAPYKAEPLLKKSEDLK